MSMLGRLPGARAGRRGRNLFVAAVWVVGGLFGGLFMLGSVLAFPALFVVYAVCLAVVAIGFGWFGLGERTADTVVGRVPLLHSEGRRGGVAAIGYAVLIFVVGLAAVGSTVPASPATNATNETTGGTDAPATTEAAANAVGTSGDGAAAGPTTVAATSGRTTASGGGSGRSAGSTARTSPSEASRPSNPPSTPGAASSKATSDANAEAGRVATVTRVIDGDTMEVRFRNGETDTVRLLGVDTPETTLSRVDPPEYEGIPDTPAGRDWLYAWGERASRFATAELEGNTVRVATDGRADRRGSFGRLLAYVYRDGQNFNRQLLAEGYARLYDSSFSKRAAFADTEARAQRSGIGLWGFDGPNPATTVRTTGDPAGGGDEYDCADFDDRGEAQRILERNPNDPSGLDADNDGQACESLPGGRDVTTTAPTATPTATATETPTETASRTPTPTTEPTTAEEPDAGSDLPPPSGGSDDPYDCGDFDSKAQAQEYYDDNPGDPSGLDADDDGEACDSGVG